MFEKIDRCPLCSAKTTSNYLICTDHQVSGESFAITRCGQCNFLFTNPRPTSTSIQKYYDSPAYISHSDSVTTLRDRMYRIVRKYNTRAKIKVLHTLHTEKTLLDFGCGTGYFLHSCKAAGWSVDGLEPNETARIKASDRLNQPVYSHRDALPQKHWEVITLWHVLEHIYELHDTVDWLKTSLTKNGRLVLALPNASSFDAIRYKEQWAGYDVPRHLYHFTPDTIKLLLQKHNLKIKQVLPMRYDAYYVSLLSERSRNAASNYINGFINGFKSNRYAKKDPSKYSSLIYIARK